MLSANGRFAIVLNGEIYNFPELRRDLQRAGVTFRGHSDTEVLLEWVAANGLESALDVIEGMFAFALLDRQAQTLTLARDRFGEKPLYYTAQPDYFAFGSELRTLRWLPGVSSDLDDTAVSLYLAQLAVPAPRTILRAVRKLSPGELLKLDVPGRTSSRRTYFDIGQALRRAALTPFRGSKADAADQLQSALLESVRERLQADVPVGALLSGGIDSSLVVAAAQQQTTGPVRTFTVSVQASGYDEGAYARQVASRFGTQHLEIRVSANDVLNEAREIGSTFDEPFADSSALVSLVVCREARRHVTVALAGDGGDELFAGYSRYWDVPRRWSKLAKLRAVPGVKLGTATLAQVMRRLDPVLRRHPVGFGPWARRLRAFTATDFLDFSRVQSAATSGVPHEVEQTQLDDSARLRRMMSDDLRVGFPDELLVKMDRSSMAHALEVRLPFLSRRIFDLAASLPDELLNDGRSGKLVPKELLSRQISPEFGSRRKMGFSVPIGEWLVGPLRELAEESIAGLTRTPATSWLQPATVRAIWRSHLSNPQPWRHEAWALVALHSWLRARS